MSTARTAGFFGSLREMTRYVMSAGLGTVLFYGFLHLLYSARLWPDHNAAFSWFLAYLTSILWTHRFHRWITFQWESSYWRSLGRTYAVYSVSVIITTTLVKILVENLGVPPDIAFISTLLVSGCGNYLMLRNWGFRAPQEPTPARVPFREP